MACSGVHVVWGSATLFQLDLGSWFATVSQRWCDRSEAPAPARNGPKVAVSRALIATSAGSLEDRENLATWPQALAVGPALELLADETGFRAIRGM
jgi:hypothetical protein